jgi:Tfp pilus assembly protein PilN
MLAWLFGLVFDPRAKLVAIGVIFVGFVLTVGYQELSRRSAITARDAAEARLQEVQKERDALRSALAKIEQQRKLSLDTAAAMKLEQKRLRDDLATMRNRLKESVSREQQCLDALAEVRRHLAR